MMMMWKKRIYSYHAVSIFLEKMEKKKIQTLQKHTSNFLANANTYWINSAWSSLW
jgi:hypothetical protein